MQAVTIPSRRPGKWLYQSPLRRALMKGIESCTSWLARQHCWGGRRSNQPGLSMQGGGGEGAVAEQYRVTLQPNDCQKRRRGHFWKLQSECHTSYFRMLNGLSTHAHTYMHRIFFFRHQHQFVRNPMLSGVLTRLRQHMCQLIVNSKYHASRCYAQWGC